MGAVPGHVAGTAGNFHLAGRIQPGVLALMKSVGWCAFGNKKSIIGLLSEIIHFKFSVTVYGMLLSDVCCADGLSVQLCVDAVLV